MAQRPLPGAPTTFSVTPETSLQGAARLTASKTYQRIAVLNFASARKPGGGFLGGAQAQEESLARSSGLYLSLLRCPEFYDFHRSLDTCLYSDRMIYSPRCPVVRDDAGLWLPTPYLVDFITSAAPNAGAIMRNEPHNRARIGPTLRERVGKVLALAAHYQVDALVLGAWGCGVFQNDPQLVAAAFYEWLRPRWARTSIALAMCFLQCATHHMTISCTMPSPTPLLAPVARLMASISLPRELRSQAH